MLGPRRDRSETASTGSARASGDMAALMDACGAAVLVLDVRGAIERSNAEADALLGRQPGQLEGLTLLEATLSDELNGVLREALSGQAVRSREVRAPGTGGGTLVVSVVPVEGTPAGAERFLLVAQNVTVLRRLETVRRDFVANVSHELRTPLASIRAMAETLQDGALEDPKVAGPFLSSIVAETERLARIADDLLVLSDAESRPGEATPFDLSELVREVAGRFQQQAARAGVSLTVDVPVGLPGRGNPDQLEQVFVNLVDNAIKYTPAGGSVRVTAEVRCGSVQVRVADTGIGVMSQHQPRIFERFYRVDKARSRQSGGTGLGLSIVKHIVESHGGTVTVESQLNRGSTFTVTLPA